MGQIALIQPNSTIVATSLYGTTGWTTSVIPGGNRNWGVHGLKYGGGRFVALAGHSSNQSVGAVSTDGTNWATMTLPAFLPWSGLCWNGSLWCAVAGANNNQTSLCATSPDGTTWTARTLPFSAFWTSVDWNGTVFCAVNQNAIPTGVATSPDGTTWTARTLPVNSPWSDIRWNGTVFCTVGGFASNRTDAATSPDGITWTQRTLPANMGWWTIDWNGTLFVAVPNANNSNQYATSPDGATWTARTFPSNGLWYNVAWNGRYFTAVQGSANTILTSPDGLAWTLHTLPSGISPVGPIGADRVAGPAPPVVWHNPITAYPIQSSLPSDWTQETGSAVWNVALDSTALNISDRVLDATTQNNDNSPVTDSWNIPGILDGDNEILVMIKMVGTPQNGQLYRLCGVKIQNNSSDSFGFFITTTSTDISTIGLGRLSGSLQQLVSNSGTAFLNNWYWLRLRIALTGGANGFGQLLGRYWPKGNAEPGTWLLTYDFPNPVAIPSGKVGLFFEKNALQPSVAHFTAAIDNNSAPMDAPIAIGAVLNGTGGLKINATTVGHKEFGNALFAPRGLLGVRATTFGDYQAGAVLTGRGDFDVVARTSRDTNIFRDEGVNFVARGSFSADISYTYRQSRRIYSGDRYVQRGRAEYAEGLANLLPRGYAWPREPERILSKFIAGQAGVWGNTVENAANLLLTKESDPRTTVAMLDWWERAWGLPDKCIAEPLSISDRQMALVAKMTILGGQSRAWFVATALKIGYTVNIREFAPFMVGISRAGDTTFLDDLGYYRWEIGRPEMRFYWAIRMAATRYTWFRCSAGQSGVDHHLEFARATDLECLLNRWKPAHTILIFNYGQFPQTGPLPFGVQFNGIDNGIVVPSNLGIINFPFSVSCWFRTASTDGVICAVGSDFSWPPNSASYENILYIGSDGRLESGWRDTQIRTEISNAPVNDSFWHHGVITVSLSKVMTLYFDNVVQGTPSTIPGSPETASWQNFYFGNGKATGWPNIDTDPGYYTGGISDMRIYNRVLLAGEIATLFNGGDVRTGLVGDYSMQDSVNAGIDSSGGLHHGTMFGQPMLRITGPLQGPGP